MNSSTGRLDFIDSLSSWTTRSGKLILHLFEVELKGKWNNWHDHYWNSARVKSSLRLSLGDSDNFVDSRLALEHLMNAVSLNSHVQSFVTRTYSWLLDWWWYPVLPPLRRAICLIHITHILYKYGTLCSSCSRPHLHDDIRTVVILRFRDEEIPQCFLYLF